MINDDENCDDWIKSSRQKQIFLVALLTASMYVLYVAFNFLVLDEQILESAHLQRLYFIIPLFLLLSLLSYKQENQELASIGLIVIPIVIAISSMIVSSKTDNFTFYLTEMNIMIFWVFIVSGLRFKQALLTALTLFLITVYSVLIYHSLYEPFFYTHLFLMFVSFALSMLKAYFIEQSTLKLCLQTKKNQELSMTDELTEFSSRSKFDFIIKNELERSRRYKYQFGLLIIEIDDFKAIYKKFGKQVRDDLLIVVSSLINEQVRSTDMEIRWSEDEFVVVCLELDIEQLQKIAYSILKSMSEYDFGRLGQVTLSAGATINKVSDNDASIVNRLKQALLKAKQDGGACVKSL
ncbi:MAG: GGDEF domain-containing protein [Campylobacterota bacterium]|nr:GGDEF domain-containing protein [Campylobacterota bacterium]